MLLTIQLAFKCERYVSQFPSCCDQLITLSSLLLLLGPKSSLEDLYNAYIAPLAICPERHTFKEWVSIGKKFALLAGGGSIYMLVIIAGLDLWREFAEMLRRPTVGKESKLRFLFTTVSHFCALWDYYRDCCIPLSLGFTHNEICEKEK